MIELDVREVSGVPSIVIYLGDGTRVVLSIEQARFLAAQLPIEVARLERWLRLTGRAA